MCLLFLLLLLLLLLLPRSADVHVAVAGCEEVQLPDGNVTYVETASPCRMAHLSQDRLLPLLYEEVEARATCGPQVPSIVIEHSHAGTLQDAGEAALEATVGQTSQTLAAGAAGRVREQRSELQLLLNSRWLGARQENSSGTSSGGPVVSLIEVTDKTTGPFLLEVTSDLLIGCDGANSRVREWGGYHLRGGPPLQHFLNITFTSKQLAHAIQQREAPTCDGAPFTSAKSTTGHSESPPVASPIGGRIIQENCERGASIRGPGYSVLQNYNHRGMLYFSDLSSKS